MGKGVISLTERGQVPVRLKPYWQCACHPSFSVMMRTTVSLSWNKFPCPVSFVCVSHALPSD
jgi:hypothetical protein